MLSNPTQWLTQLAVFALPMLLAITVHEVAHGLVAYRLGDPTAKLAGRLTLNPLKHLDPLGVLAFALTRMIGWAKPVPVDASYFRNPRSGMVLVSLAGPGSNFALALASVLFLHGLEWVHALAGSPNFSRQILVPLAYMGEASVQVNLSLGIFNLLPIPPLDGGHILAGLLPGRLASQLMRLAPFGFVLLMLLAVTGILGRILFPAVDFLYNFIM